MSGDACQGISLTKQAYENNNNKKQVLRIHQIQNITKSNWHQCESWWIIL